jgi:hypothetical protein
VFCRQRYQASRRLHGLDQVGPRQVAEKIEQGRHQCRVRLTERWTVHDLTEVEFGEAGLLDLSSKALPENVPHQERISPQPHGQWRIVWRRSFIESQQIDPDRSQPAEIAQRELDPPAPPAREKLIRSCH